MQDIVDRLQDSTVAEWGIAVAAALATYFVLILALKFVLARFNSSKASTPPAHRAHALGEALAEMLNATRHGLIALVALLVGVGVLDLPERWAHRVSQLWFVALALQVALWGMAAIRVLLRRYITRHAPTETEHQGATATLIAWGLRTALWVVVLLAILSNLGVNITAFVASLGVGGVAVALAVQNILGDLFASLSIAVDKPFEVGDFVIVGSAMGSIEHVGLKSTRIRSLGGEQIVMSNTDLLKQTISNYKRLMERRVVFVFRIPFDTSPDQAAEVPRIIERIVKSSDRLRFDRAHFRSFGDSSLEYEVVYFVLSPDYNLYMDEQQRINLALMRELGAIGVRFAFPTRTVMVAGDPVQYGAAGPNGEDARARH